MHRKKEMGLKKNKPTWSVFALLVIGSISLFFFAEKGLSDTQVSFADSDKDGLSNDEERSYGTDPSKVDSDNDGYSDGVEVRSGFNPLKPAPGDRVIAANAEESGSAQENSDGKENLTQKVSDKLNEYVRENGGKEGDFGIEELDSIITETMDGQIGEETLPEIDPKNIKIKKQNYGSLGEEEKKKREKEDAIAYLTTIAYLAASNSPVAISSDADMEKFTQELIYQASSLINGASGMGYFDDLADRGALYLSQMNEVEVPEKMVPLHVKGLQLASYALDLKKRTAINPDDPMALLISLSKVQNLIEKSSAFQEEILSNLRTFGISIETNQPSDEQSE